MTEIYDYALIGLGPAGIGFINSIKPNRKTRVAVIDAGDDMQHRKCKILENEKCSNCNLSKCKMIHGIGGASLLGGHKISSFPAGSYLNELLLNGDQDIEYFESILHRLSSIIHLIRPNIQYLDITKAKHFYSKLGYEFKYYDSYLCNIDNLKKGFTLLIHKIKHTDLYLNSTVIEIKKEDSIYYLKIKNEKGCLSIRSKKIIFAVGRSGIDLLAKSNLELALGAEPNHLELGIRLEFPSNIFEDIDKYHKDLKLIRNNIRTFCVSKHGKLSPYFCNGLYIVDGFFDISSPTGFTNLALMYRLDKNINNAEIFDSVIKNMNKHYKLVPIIQDYISFRDHKKEVCNNKISSSISYLTKGSVFNIYPDYISEALIEETSHFMNSFIKKEDFDKVNIVAPAIEYFWLDFPIKNDFSIHENIYFIGDCSGKYRGILQAFLAGSILGNKLFHK